MAVDVDGRQLTVLGGARVAKFTREDEPTEPRKDKTGGGAAVLVVTLAIAGGLLLACVGGGFAVFWLGARTVDVDRQEAMMVAKTREMEARAEAARDAAGETRSAAAPRAARDGRILFFRRGTLSVIRPDGTGEAAAGPKPGADWPRPSRTEAVAPRLSHDGSRVAYFAYRPEPKTRDDTSRLIVQRLDPSGPPTDAGLASGHAVAWSPDGQELAVTYSVPHPDKPDWLQFRHARVNAETHERSPLAIPAGHRRVIDWVAGGGQFLTLSGDTDRERLHLVDLTGRVTADLTPEGWIVYCGRLSPDGTGVAVLGWSPEDLEPATRRKKYAQVLWVKTGRDEKFRRLFADRKRVFWGVCWSPDGKRIGYGFCDLEDGLAYKLTTADPDGGSETVVATEPHRRWDAGGVIVALDWR